MDYSNVMKVFAFVNGVLPTYDMTTFIENFFKAKKSDEGAVVDLVDYLVAADAEEMNMKMDLKRMIVLEAKDRLQDMAKTR